MANVHIALTVLFTVQLHPCNCFHSLPYYDHFGKLFCVWTSKKWEVQPLLHFSRGASVTPILTVCGRVSVTICRKLKITNFEWPQMT